MKMSYTGASTIMDIIRTILVTVIDRPGFFLLKVSYEIFFNVATSEILSSATIKSFYYRIQLILGVFMIFRLSISILQSIVSPDKLTEKGSGTMSIIGRIFIGLALLVALTPLSIPSPRNSYEEELNNNGLIFGTLYSLQDRILSQNVIGKLILPTSDSSVNTSTNNATVSQGQKLTETGNIFATTIVKTFVRINTTDDKEPDPSGSNWVCPQIDQSLLDVYQDEKSNPGEILSLVNYSCTSAANQSLGSRISSGLKKLIFAEDYAFGYWPFGGIVAIVFSFLLFSFSIDIAIRAIKLAALRMIAPIPVISYMSPGNPKKQKGPTSFDAWLHTLISTYIDIFIRLAVVYMILFLIQDIIKNGLVINTNGGVIGGISFILIALGLFLFARQAPKFFRDALGLKGPGMSNIGLNALAGGAAAAIGGGGLVGAAEGMLSGAENSMQAYNQGKQFTAGNAWRQSGDRAAQIRTGNKNARGGLIGRTQDYTDYQQRERQAQAYGIGRDALADANYEKKLAESRAKQAKAEYEDYMSRHPLTGGTPPNADEVARLRANIERSNSAFEAADKKVKGIEKDRSELGLSSDVRGRRHGGYRAEREVATKKIDGTINGIATGVTFSVKTDGTDDGFVNVSDTAYNYQPTDYESPHTRADADARRATNVRNDDIKNFTDLRDPGDR